MKKLDQNLQCMNVRSVDKREWLEGLSERGLWSGPGRQT